MFLIDTWNIWTLSQVMENTLTEMDFRVHLFLWIADSTIRSARMLHDISSVCFAKIQLKILMVNVPCVSLKTTV